MLTLGLSCLWFLLAGSLWIIGLCPLLSPSLSLAFKVPKREFPGGLVLRIQGFHYRGLGSVSGQELRSCKLHGAAKKKKKVPKRGADWFF